jgi:lipopolysaccharide biosynthesis glycosyltransferase
LVQPIEIVMAVDESYLRQLAVAVASLAANTDDACRIHVLHDGVSHAARDRLSHSVRDSVELQWLDARELSDAAVLPTGKPRSMYFRLFLGALLPPPVERVVYLDADVLVRRSLRDLWEADLDGCVLGAVRDAYRPWMVRNTTFHWRTEQVPPDAPFFNTGVLLVDLEQWRRDDLGARALAVLADSATMFDQCALNVLMVGGFAALHPRWNLQTYHLVGDDCLAFAAEGRDRLDAAVRDPAVVHFTGGTYNRPWEAPCGNPYRDEWLATLDRTAWRGWRPAPTPPLARAVQRSKRALRVLRYGGGAEFRSSAAGG